ncbi:MAG: ribonuclease HII [Verrucomicrobiales bacterium]|nr:ribonuclease HII [Verrucomicrobiales bacterium]
MPDLSYELALQEEGFPVVAGIDEAGRGPLAGPVSVAAVVLPDSYTHEVLNDSKQLTEKKRELLYEEITNDASIRWASVMVEADEIDEINILQATWEGMRRSFLKLEPRPDVALIDGKPVKDFPSPHRGLVKGDGLSLSIAAASIIAKVERDRLMIGYAAQYPEYGFERHKGYGTALHKAALSKYGPCPLHRMSFAPVAAAAKKRR